MAELKGNSSMGDWSEPLTGWTIEPSGVIGGVQLALLLSLKRIGAEKAARSMCSLVRSRGARLSGVRGAMDDLSEEDCEDCRPLALDGVEGTTTAPL